MITSWSIGINLYAYIRQHLERGSTILELGSGPGSQLLSIDYKMTCVEHSPEYCYKYDIPYIPAEIKNDWYDLNKKRIPDYDLLLVDGPPENIGREGILNHLDLFDHTKPVIVDDTHRDTEFKIAQVISSWKDNGVMALDDQHDKQFSVIW